MTEIASLEDFRAARAVRHGPRKLKHFTDEKTAKAIGDYLLGLHRKTSPANEGVPSQGGFLAPELLADFVADLRDKAGVARQLLRVVPMKSDKVNVATRQSGFTGYYVDENAAITDGRAGYGLVGLNSRKIAALTLASTEQADDSALLADFVLAELAYALETMVDLAAFAGDGTSTYKGQTGFINAILGLAGAVAATSTHKTWATFDLGDFEKLMGTLPARFHADAQWVVSSIGWSACMLRLSAATGLPVELNGKPAFLGYPVVLCPAMPAGTASTDYSGLAAVGFGDWDMAGLLGDRVNVRIARADQRYIEFDQVAWRAVTRFHTVWHGLGTASAAGAAVALVGTT